MEQIKYRFLSDKHVHQVYKDEEWKNLVGTSGIPNILAKPLTWWASGLAVATLGWTSKKDKDRFVPTAQRVEIAGKKLDEIKKMSNEEYLKLLDEGYAAHSKKLDSSATAGTDLHALAEEWIKGQIDGSNVSPNPLIMPLVNWAKVNVSKWLWSEMHCYSETMWVGGISDAGYIDKDGRVAILDIKSSKDAYDGQYIQCAGYDKQITENGGYTADGKKVFDLGDKEISYYTIFPFGMDKPEGKSKHNKEDLCNDFDACLYLYKRLN